MTDLEQKEELPQVYKFARLTKALKARLVAQMGSLRDAQSVVLAEVTSQELTVSDAQIAKRVQLLQDAFLENAVSLAPKQPQQPEAIPDVNPGGWSEDEYDAIKKRKAAFLKLRPCLTLAYAGHQGDLRFAYRKAKR